MPDLAPYGEAIKWVAILLTSVASIGTVLWLRRASRKGIEARQDVERIGEAQQSQREHRDRIDAETEAGEDAFDRGAGRPRD